MASRYGINGRHTRDADKFLNGLFKVGKSMARAYEREAKRQQREQARQVAAYNRFVAQEERERIRQIKQHEMALRREEREREKAARERERAAKLKAKLDEQHRLEEEISDIEDTNFLWTNVHSFISHIVTPEDTNEIIHNCDFEQKYDIRRGYFKVEYPSDTLSKQQAQKEADKCFDIQKAQKDFFEANKKYVDLYFDLPEPTIDSVTAELQTKAKEQIKAFFPWTQSKLRKAYVAENLENTYKEKHDAWKCKKTEYDSQKEALLKQLEEKENAVAEMKKSKKEFFIKRAAELYDVEVKSWEKEREIFYNTLRQNTQDVIDGDKDYVISAISSLFPDDELPMEYFVDFAYVEEEGKVLVDLDLPEIEDIPDKKIALTPSGKKSIRLKGQTDLRSDYVNCIFGLAMHVAYSIFNISLKINEIEISGFTQRKEVNSAVATDQYVFVVDFTRDLFSEIDFSKLSPLQIMDFFKHYFNMTKSFDLKQISLSSAYEKMENFIPADYNDFLMNSKN